MYSTYQPTTPAYYNPYLYYPQIPTVTPVPQPVASVPQQTATAIPSIKLDTVSGRTAADVYEVNAGEEAVLIDIDNPCVYRKTRGTDNKLEFQIYDLIPHVDQDSQSSAPVVNLDEYVKADAIEDIVTERVKKEVDKRLSEISFTPATKKRTKVVEVLDE